MPLARIIVAGTGFSAIRRYILETMPDMDLDMIDAQALREHGASAEVLIPAMAKVDGGLMDKIQDLRMIHQWGTGLEGVDVPAATTRGIAVVRVTSAGTGNAESVAEWCVMAAIAVSRCLPQTHQAMREGQSWGGPIGRALLGRTAGIVGLGGIGQALAQRLRPFGMRMLGVKRTAEPGLAHRLGLEWVGGMERLPELLGQSDYLFLCLPLDHETRGIMDSSALGLLPPQACLVNAGRGGLVDQAALLEALKSGRLMGAGLDVFEQEPLDPSSELLLRQDIVATPHIAGVTDASYNGIARRVADNVRRVLDGEMPQDCLNWEAIHGR